MPRFDPSSLYVKLSCDRRRRPLKLSSAPNCLNDDIEVGSVYGAAGGSEALELCLTLKTAYVVVIERTVVRARLHIAR
jgi:hypothetical protein